MNKEVSKLLNVYEVEEADGASHLVVATSREEALGIVVNNHYGCFDWGQNPGSIRLWDETKYEKFTFWDDGIGKSVNVADVVRANASQSLYLCCSDF